MVRPPITVLRLAMSSSILWQASRRRVRGAQSLTEAQARGKHDVLMRVKTTDGTRFVALPLNNNNT
jgi:hypothetical protein